MDLGRHAAVERQFDRAENGLLVMVQNERQDLHHLPITPGMFEQVSLQPPERIRHLGEGSPVAQGSRLALEDSQIVTPVVDRAPGYTVRARDDPRMLAQDPTFGRHDDALRVDPQAHGPIGERGWNRIAVALEVHEAGR